MKRSLLTTILLLAAVTAGAQSLSVSSFRPDQDDFSAVALSSRRTGPDGELCALIKISTRLTGLSFDAGETCVIDVSYASPGVWVYLPASARAITISHRQAGTLRRWYFPVSLEPGRTYQMTLKAEMPKPVYTPKPKPVKPAFNTDGFASHFIQSHIGLEVCEGIADCAVFGLSYSFMPSRWGFYTSVDINTDGCIAAFAGPSVRMLESSSTVDWQLYAGPGYVPYSGLGADFGTKLGWHTEKAVSKYDFSLGCQYWGKGAFVPYVGLGAKITCYTVAITIGLCLSIL